MADMIQTNSCTVYVHEWNDIFKHLDMNLHKSSLQTEISISSWIQKLTCKVKKGPAAFGYLWLCHLIP